MRLKFTKMQGAGNDFIVVDATREATNLDPPIIRKLANRHFGVGFDQLVLWITEDAYARGGAGGIAG